MYRVLAPGLAGLLLLCAGCFEAAEYRPWTGEADADADAGTDADAETGPSSLLVSPLGHSPTADAIKINAVTQESREALRLEWRPVAAANQPRQWTAVADATLLGTDVKEWRITGLQPGADYEYRVSDGIGAPYPGRFVTQRLPGQGFTFALLADTHIFVESPEDVAHVLEPVAELITADRPDLVLHLGDVLDYHVFGFNDPPPDESWPRLGMLAYREMTGRLLGRTAHFAMIGNWDGESGYFSPAEIERSRSQRQLYLPNPEPTTYPEGGSEHEDYYAFTWGDALFVVLNVMSYTMVPHELTAGPADDWTLGAEQLAWLAQTLEQADARWRFLCIHHPVGGNGGDGEQGANSAYGRGGGRAAYVGQQAEVHDLMLQHGVQVFFYGHDHVFHDMEVDGVHYTLPGSAGAPWKFVTAETGYETYWPESGYGRVRVEPEQLTIEFVSMWGEVLNTIEIE